MFDAFHYPIEIMRFRFELSDQGGRIGGDRHFLSGFSQHGHLDLAERAGRHIVFEAIHQLEIFVGDFEDSSPDLFSGRWDHAGEAASPLGGPSAEFDRVFGKSGQHQESMLRCAAFQLCRVEMVPVEEELH